MKVWHKFHNYWLRSPQQIPTYFLRFEDLVTRPEHSLCGLFKFLLNRESLSGLEIEARIKQSVSAQTQVYKPRSGKINSNLQLYSAEMIEEISAHCESTLRRFGYTEAVKGGELQEPEALERFNEKMRQCAAKAAE